MSKIENKIKIDKVEDVNSLEYLLEKRQALLKVMAISTGIDFVMFVPEMAAAMPSFFSSIIMEEVIEYFISNTIAKYQLDTDVKMTDRAVGFIPVPGVTGLNVRCLKELRKLNKKIKKLERNKK